MLWIAQFITGFALIIWPFMNDGYHAAAQPGDQLGFIDALYYSGVTFTVLGYGDIVPLTWPFKIEAPLPRPGRIRTVRT